MSIVYRKTVIMARTVFADGKKLKKCTEFVVFTKETVYNDWVNQTKRKKEINSNLEEQKHVYQF